MSSMSLSFGLGFVPARREPESTQLQRGAAMAAPPILQEETKVKRRIEDLTLNELLFQALYGDLGQFSVDV
jgi:hypothetical protein